MGPSEFGKGCHNSQCSAVAAEEENRPVCVLYKMKQCRFSFGMCVRSKCTAGLTHWQWEWMIQLQLTGRVAMLQSLEKGELGLWEELSFRWTQSVRRAEHRAPETGDDGRNCVGECTSGNWKEISREHRRNPDESDVPLYGLRHSGKAAFSPRVSWLCHANLRGVAGAQFPDWKTGTMTVSNSVCSQEDLGIP